MTPLRFTIPGPPVPAGRPRAYVTKTGKAGTYMPDASRKYASHARVCTMAAAAIAKWKPGRGPYSLLLLVYRDRDVGDGDNYAKSVVDAMAGVVFENDKFIHDWRVCLFIDRVRPRVEVKVTQLDTEWGAA